MRLASKLTLALICVMCVVLSIYGYLSVRRERALFESDTRNDEHIIGSAIGPAVAELWRRDGAEGAMQLIDTWSRRDDGVHIRWVWLDAPPGAAHAPSVPAAQLSELEAGSDVFRVVRSGDRDRFYTYVPVAVEKPRVGAIELSESREEEERYVTESVVRTVTTIVALAALSGLMAMGLGAVLVGRPTRRLIDKARRIGEGELGDPLVLEQRDELGQLATAINQMCDNLAEARERAAAETSARIATLEQLRHADRLTTVGKLASGIAHELGTPLNVVGGRAKMIVRGCSTEEGVDNARIIVEQADRMAKIIRQLLDFARTRTVQKSPVDLAQVARQTIVLLDPLARKRRVTLRYVGDVDAGRGAAASFKTVADVDASQMQQVLTNLVMNGVHAMKGGGELTIAVERERLRPPADHGGPEGEYLAIRVVDQGEGIPDDVLPRIFEPFFTTKDIGEGTGLGLSVTYGIVREHGGWIAVESEAKKGSRFTVYLSPGGVAHAEGGTEARPARQITAPAPALEDKVA
jgi:signal transduction histidine kinase